MGAILKPQGSDRWPDKLTARFVSHEDRDLRCIANVIITRGSHVAAQLHSLYVLEQRGCEIRASQFSAEAIVVDGRTEFLNTLPDLIT